MKSLDLTGTRQGRLLAIRPSGKNKHGHTLWLCKCDCGSDKILSVNSFRNQKTKSCGCMRKELLSLRRWKGYQEISGEYWANVQRNALERGIPFNLKIEDVWALYLSQKKICALSGRSIKFTRSRGGQTASLDRIDPLKGYFLLNVQWVHKVVNTCKMGLQNSDFIEICKEIAAYSAIQNPS